MIKGVSRQVIEITETGSEYFEKMLLVVKPQYSSMNVKKLKKKAGSVAVGVSQTPPPPPSKRKRPSFLASAAKLSAAAGAGAALTAVLIRL